MAPALSVIIPVYNTEKYLKACIESILHQTFKDYEIILVDDGSTDASDIICEAFAATYDYITVIHKENGGPTHTRKTGLYASKGAYISYIDSDDTIAPDMYAVMMGKAEKYNADMVICDMQKCAGVNDVFIRNCFEAGFYDKDRLEKCVYPKLLAGGDGDFPGMTSSLCNKIIKREILERVLAGTDERISYGEDALCTVPCLLDSQRVYICGEAFYYYRMVGSSIMHTFNRGRMRELILLINQLDRVFEERGFDGGEQLGRYAARTSIECIRSELLFDKEASVKERIGYVREFLKDPKIAAVINSAAEYGFSRVNDAKIKLIKKEKFFTLYLIYYLKNIMIKLGGE